MEDTIIDKMKRDDKLNECFTSDELDVFLRILCSNESDAKRQEEFIKLIKGERR